MLMYWKKNKIRVDFDSYNMSSDLYVWLILDSCYFTMGVSVFFYQLFHNL